MNDPLGETDKYSAKVRFFEKLLGIVFHIRKLYIYIFSTLFLSEFKTDFFILTQLSLTLLHNAIIIISQRSSFRRSKVIYRFFR